MTSSVEWSRPVVNGGAAEDDRRVAQARDSNPHDQSLQSRFRGPNQGRCRLLGRVSSSVGRQVAAGEADEGQDDARGADAREHGDVEAQARRPATASTGL